MFRRFCEAITEQCVAAGVVWGPALSIDSTKVEANAALDSLQPRVAVEAHLGHLVAARHEDDRSISTAHEPAQEDDPVLLPVDLTDADRAALAERAATRHDWFGASGRPDQHATSGAYRRTAEFRVSTTDPDATPMPRETERTHLEYHDHYVVDGGKARIILTTLVTPAEVQDNQPAVDLLWRTRCRWKVRPRPMTGDTKVRHGREHCGQRN